MVIPFLSPTALPPAQITHIISMLQYGCTALVQLETYHLHVAHCIKTLCKACTQVKLTSHSEQEAYQPSNWQTTVPVDTDASA